MSKFAEGIGEEVRKLAGEALGASFWLQTTVFSNAIKAQGTNLNLTAASERGDLLCEDITIRGHSGDSGAGGGLVSATDGDTLRIICTNTYGSSVVFAARIADVGTSSLVNMESARDLITTEQSSLDNERVNRPFVLEEGKRLQIHNIAGVGLGDGKVDVRIKFRRLADDANVTV